MAVAQQSLCAGVWEGEAGIVFYTLKEELTEEQTEMKRTKYEVLKRTTTHTKLGHSDCRIVSGPCTDFDSDLSRVDGWTVHVA